MQLVNPADGSESDIPNTEGATFLLPLENGSRMLVQRDSYGNYLLQSMDFDGANRIILREKYFLTFFTELLDGNLLTEDIDLRTGEGTRNVLNPETGETYPASVSIPDNSYDYLPLEFDRLLERVAYWDGKGNLQILTYATGQTIRVGTTWAGWIRTARMPATT